MDDYYSVLGCDQDASQQHIRKQYKKLALQFHPDKNTQQQGSQDTADKFDLLNKAVVTLTDHKEKHKYDSSLLEKQSCNKIVNDEISLEEFTLNQDDSCFIYECRCGGQFIVGLDFEAKLTIDPNIETIIDCNCCSLSVLVKR